jgi:hypothetical protein
MWNTIAGSKPFAAPQAGSGISTPTGPSNNINSSGVGHYYNLTTQARLDHSFTDRIKVFGSYSTGSQHQPGINNVIAYAPYDANQLVTYTLQNAATIGLTYTISPTFISETRVGEYRQTNNPKTAVPDDQFALAKTVPNLPAGVYLNPIGSGLPTEGKYGNGSLGQGTLSVSVNNNHQFRQDFTKILGTHSFKFGYEWLWQNFVGHNAQFRRHERHRTQLRLDFFNPFKWFHWNTLATTMSQTQPSLFGTIPLGDFGDSTEGGPPEMQISFRIKF